MYKLIIFFSTFLFSTTLFAQINLGRDARITNGRMLNDSLNEKFNEEVNVELDGKTHYTDYKIISFRRDTTIIDTTLSLKKERIFNYIRKNTFELLPFHNVGQTYNRLGYDFSDNNIFPEMGIKAKQYNFYKTEDINYYRVPTPTSELFFHTGIQQGHVLNSMITANVNPQLNISVAYKGLRSLGDYRNALSSHQNFRISAIFKSKSNRYELRTYYAGQNLFNEENGGLTDLSLLYYSTNNPEYKDRERLETNFIDAESRLKTRGYFLEHGYNLWYHPVDSINKQSAYLQIGHEFQHNNSFYTFKQSKANKFFGSAYDATIADSTFFYKTDNAVFMELKSSWILGKIRVKANYSQLNYGYNSIIYFDENTIPARINGHNTSLQARWDTHFKTFGLSAEAGSIFEGILKGNFINGTATYSKDSLLTFKASLMLKSRSPDYNFLLYQSAYENFNWAPNLENENTRTLSFALLSDRLLDADVSFVQKDYYTYFDENSKPTQYSKGLTYLKVKIHKELSWRKWALDNTLMYQEVGQGKNILHVPEIVTENTFYFSDDVFKRKPLYLQTGFTVKYFSKYFADEFNPLLNEFRLQNTAKVGDYPMLDYFLNARIQRTRLFFKLENLTSLWDGGKYLVTPTQPYRDFTLRFGLVWNFFI